MAKILSKNSLKMFNEFLNTFLTRKVVAVEVNKESLIVTTTPPEPQHAGQTFEFKLEGKKGTQVLEVIALAEELAEYTDEGIAVLNSYLQDHGLHLQRIEE